MTEWNIEEHFDRLKSLIELEEAEEIETFRREFTESSPEEREQTGKALRRMVLFDLTYSPAGHVLLILKRLDGKDLPFYSLDAGDVVVLSADPPQGGRFPFGTVYEREDATITVAFNKALPEWIHDEQLTISKTANRSTYEKMYDVIDEIKTAKHGRLAQLRSLTFGLKKPVFHPPSPLTFFDSGLNDPQRNAVKLADRAQDITLIHGPPGTGKTTALVEIIRQAHAKGERVFASAPSNIACDNLLEKLYSVGLPVLRLGHPARILHHLRDLCLDHRLAQHAEAKHIVDVERTLDEQYRRRNRQKEKGRWTREDESRFREQTAVLKVEEKSLSGQLFRQVMEESRIIVGTHVSAASNDLGDIEFDLVVLDEATQAIEPLSWIALSHSKRVVLAGDHWQLPPTVRSAEAERGGLGISLFERLMEQLPEEAKILLTVQYRMHKHIMGFSSAQFYDNQLVADESVADHTLADLAGVADSDFTREPFIFIDTAGCSFEEALEPGSQSRFNAREAGLVLSQLKKLLEAGLKPYQIALISPYSAQVRYLESKWRDKSIEIDSVDGFQGREKEAVIVSLVRSNLEGELGFLVDKRRMNVALTRARRKLIVIGDSATLGSIPFYKAFIEYAEKVGGYHTAWDYPE